MRRLKNLNIEIEAINSINRNMAILKRLKQYLVGNDKHIKEGAVITSLCLDNYIRNSMIEDVELWSLYLNKKK